MSFVLLEQYVFCRKSRVHSLGLLSTWLRDRKKLIPSTTPLLCITRPGPDPDLGCSERSSKQMAQGWGCWGLQEEPRPGQKHLSRHRREYLDTASHTRSFRHISILENASSEQGPSQSAMAASHPILYIFRPLELHLSWKNRKRRHIEQFQFTQAPQAEGPS